MNIETKSSSYFFSMIITEGGTHFIKYNITIKLT